MNHSHPMMEAWREVKTEGDKIQEKNTNNETLIKVLYEDLKKRDKKLEAIRKNADGVNVGIIIAQSRKFILLTQTPEKIVNYYEEMLGRIYKSMEEVLGDA